MNARLLTFWLLFFDWFASTAAWSVFYYARKTRIEEVEFTVNSTFYWGVFIIPVMWVLLYALQGTYQDVRRLYRLKTLSLTFLGTILGTVCIFFVFLLDDEITEYRQYYAALGLLFIIQFLFILIPRVFIVSYVVGKIHRRKAGFKTLLVGGSDKAVDIYNEINNLPKGIGHDFVGFININGVDKQLAKSLKHLGHLDDIERILKEYKVEEVIIALESVEHDRLKKIISRIECANVRIKILPDMYDILSGTVEMSNIFGALLINVSTEVMPVWQMTLKRLIDILVSVISIVVLLPLYIVLAILVKMSSPGPIFFLQERVGRNGEIFNIVKFRTMYINSEKNGPQLSSSNDPRITKIGRFMRKSRLDEFPQFFNVLVGQMSLVGPRPERQYYIDKIVEVEPQFLELTKVRPGITSWGQVKYGYAENIEQMLDRMKFDLLYLKNRSISLDIKIMLYTVLIIFKGTGK